MRRSLMLACVAFAISEPFAGAADWYNWRGPWQTGVSPETNLPAKWSPDPKAEDSNLIWSAPYGCRSTPLVLGGRVYMINYTAEKVKTPEGEKDRPETIEERVMCLDADTGKVLWQHTFPVFHTDIVTVRLGWTNLAADPKTGYVYAHGTQGLLFCFDRDGKVIWQHSLSEEYGRISGYGGRVTSPVIADDLLVIGMLNSSWGDQGKGGGRFVAMDKKTGQIRWWSEPGGQPKSTYYSVPVVTTINGERLLISGGCDGYLYALKLNTGEKAWSYLYSASAINCSPVVDPETGYVYIGHGEENPDNNVQGRFICVDAKTVENGAPKLVWQQDGVKARYASPILDTKENLVYVPDDTGNLYCFDAKTGKKKWRFPYGRNARGSPVLADGKIYVAEVNSYFHILKPEAKKCVRLHKQFFPSPDGISDVELNGSPAVANGRVYLTTGDEIYCIGMKDAKPAAEPTIKTTVAKGGAKATHVQIVPADVALHPGETVSFDVRLFDEHGQEMGARELKEAAWSLPAPPPPPGAKTGPPALDGKIADGKLTVDAKKPSQQGYVGVKVGDLVGKARVRVAPRLPYSQDFSKIPDGAVPGGWVNTQGKFLVKTVDGDKVLAKVTDKASPLVAHGNAYIGLPTLSDYTIEADVRCGKSGDDLPDFGIVAHRYTLFLAGNIQKLRLVSWDALPRVDKTIPWSIEPGVWYRLKLTTEIKGDTGVIKGKAWKRGETEPSAWGVILDDPRPIREGAPALYGYVTGIPEGGSGTDIFYDNVSIVPNKK